MGSKVFVGIDVGKDGGVVAIDESQNILIKSGIPRVGTQVNLKGLFGLLLQLKDHDVYIAIEDVHSIHGASAKANFSFGEIKGIKLGMIEALGVLYDYKYILVPPKTWQKKVWNSRDMEYKPKKPNSKINRRNVDTKKTSLLAAMRLFPNTDFRKTERSIKQHDGIIDAALIALFVYLEFK